MRELCDFDPKTMEPAIIGRNGRGEGVYEGCGNPATVSLGSGRNNWHLCESCSSLPRFRRFINRRILVDREVAP
jgi:hypothetical protein